jgi:hypothetical protein
MPNPVRWEPASAILGATLLLAAFGIVSPSLAETPDSAARYEYAALYQEVDGETEDRRESWRFASADQDTGALELDAFAKALGMATAPKLHNTRIVNLLAQQGWELVTHARSQSPKRWMSTAAGSSATTSTSRTFTEVWHFRRAK